MKYLVVPVADVKNYDLNRNCLVVTVQNVKVVDLDQVELEPIQELVGALFPDE